MIKYWIVLAMVFLLSCSKDKAVKFVENEEDNSLELYCDSVTVSFSSQIQPLFIQSCATSNCHNTSSSSAGYVLETYAQINSNATILLKSIRHDGASAMPKFQQKLNDSLIQQFECWISQGKLNN